MSTAEGAYMEKELRELVAKLSTLDTPNKNGHMESWVRKRDVLAALAEKPAERPRDADKEAFTRGRYWEIAEYKRHLVEHNPQIGGLCSWCRMEVEAGRIAERPQLSAEQVQRAEDTMIVQAWYTGWQSNRVGRDAYPTQEEIEIVRKLGHAAALLTGVAEKVLPREPVLQAEPAKASLKRTKGSD